MIEIKRGTIVQQIFSRPGIEAYWLKLGEREERCIVYPHLVGEVAPGDEVLVNTTAQTLNLGSGGYHYVIANLHNQGCPLPPGGHIMKLRYTPLQLKVMSVEEEDSPYHEIMRAADSLDGIPVLVGTLHSMLAPLCLRLHAWGYRVAYVMTDGAALPAHLSETVAWLKESGQLLGTVTAGHAFGGDLEAVNVYSGLLAARKVLQADVIVVCMGPGIVGTGTRWGFSGVEQGEILNAAQALGGTPIAVPRISFADTRERHRGISHHTLTVLSRVCRVNAVVPLPELEEDKMSCVLQQLQDAGLFSRHHICLEPVYGFADWLKEQPRDFTTMGRGVNEDREFFLALGAAACSARRLLKGEKLARVWPA